MTTLGEAARAYFEAGGYHVLRETVGFLDLVRTAPRAGLPVRLLIWSEHSSHVAQGQVAASGLDAAERSLRDGREAELLDSFAREMAASPDATGYFLVSRRLGLSRAFVSKATEILAARKGGIRVPGELFDAAYRADAESGKSARSVMGDVLALAARVRRVAQPFFVRTGLGPDERVPGNGDLVEVLDTVMKDTGRGPRLIVIDGAAGGGKSVAFNALVRLAYEEFRAAKAAKLSGRRPIVFLPEHIRGEAIGYVDDVIDQAIMTDMAAAVEAEQVHWLLHNGLALWMFDGLDEFYAGDNDFFPFLDGVLSKPGSDALIVISTRDSLTSTSESLRAFLKRNLRTGRVELYELAPWDASCWRHLAWLELENGRAGAESSERVRAFVAGLEAAPGVAALARLPFYCTLLLNRFKASRAMPKDELELMDLVVEEMFDREHGKSIFRWRDFADPDVVGALLVERDAAGLGAAGHDGAALEAALDQLGRESLGELIEAVAHGIRRTPDEARPGFDAGALKAVLSPGYYSPDIGEEDVRRLSTVLVQFALFGPARTPGAIDFTHEIIADYMAGRHALALLSHEAQRHRELSAAGQAATLDDLKRRAAVMRQAIGTAPFRTGSMFHRVLARGVRADGGLRALLAALAESGGLDRNNAVAALDALLAQSA